MQKVMKYVIFETRWGHFGLAGSESGLCRTQLPGLVPETVKSLLLRDLPASELDKTLFRILQEQITAYFEGARVNFNRDIHLSLDGFSPFGISVLTACRDVEFGQTTTYAELARRSGRPTASRAVGGALGKNPVPLIIPCHRVVRSDGKIGGFSVPGGITVKERMLKLERGALSTRVCRI